MKVPAVLMTDHLGEVASSFDASESIVVEDMPVMADVKTNSAFLEFRDASDRDNPHRPYLHIIGQVDEVRGEFPYGVTSASVADGVPVDIFYEFTDQELANMTLKGMYRRGFEAPVELLRYPMVDLPMNCNVQAFYEEQSGIPIMFIEVVDAHTLAMDKATSGYTLGDYFKEPVVQNDFDAQFDDQFATIDVSKFDFENAFKTFEQPAVEAEESVELTPEEQALVEHYMNVNQRVTDLHLNGQLTADEIMGRDKYDTLEIEPMTLDLEAEDMGIKVSEPAPKSDREKAIADAIALLKTVPEYKSLVTEPEVEPEAKVLGSDEKSAEVATDEVADDVVVDTTEDEAAARLREKQRIAREAADAAIERAESEQSNVSVDDIAADVESHESSVDFVDNKPESVVVTVDEPESEPAVDSLDAIREQLAASDIEDEFAKQFADMDESFDINVLKDVDPEPVSEPVTESQVESAPEPRKIPEVAQDTNEKSESMDF